MLGYQPLRGMKHNLIADPSWFDSNDRFRFRLVTLLKNNKN